MRFAKQLIVLVEHGGRWPPILAGRVRTVARTRGIGLIAVAGMTSNHAAALRIELPNASTYTNRRRRSCDEGWIPTEPHSWSRSARIKTPDPLQPCML